MRPASPPERERLNALFAELCAIPSPSGHERACADRVIAELRDIGLQADEDETGNLFARIPGRGDRTILLCAHLDTVPHGDVPLMTSPAASSRLRRRLLTS